MRFAPTSRGPKSATLTIASNDSNEGAYTIDLTGTALTARESWRLLHFGATGMKTRLIDAPETLELAKLAETTYFGVIIAFAQELNRYAQQVGATLTGRFRILYSEQVASLTPQDQLVLYGLRGQADRVFGITAVDEAGRAELVISAAARADRMEPGA